MHYLAAVINKTPSADTRQYRIWFMGKDGVKNSIDVFLSFFKPAVALPQQRTDFHSLIVRCSDTDTSIGNSSDTAKNAGLGISEYTNLCTDYTPHL